MRLTLAVIIGYNWQLKKKKKKRYSNDAPNQCKYSLEQIRINFCE